MLSARSSENSETNESETLETQSPDNMRTKLNDGSTTTHQYFDGGDNQKQCFSI